MIKSAGSIVLRQRYPRLNKLELKKGGVYDIRYTRFENCGMKNLKGRYCSNFHYSSKCPKCKLIGNAYENAIQSAATIHGTHHSVVDNNVMWNSSYGSSNALYNHSSVRCSVISLQNNVCIYRRWK